MEPSKRYALRIRNKSHVNAALALEPTLSGRPLLIRRVIVPQPDKGRAPKPLAKDKRWPQDTGPSTKDELANAHNGA